MKMLDEGSVVRESEFALARDTAGLFANLKNMVEQKKTGKFLTTKQREDFKRLAAHFMESTEKGAKREKKKLEAIIKNYNLNPDNIFGAVEEVAEVKEETPPTKSYMKFAKVK